MKGDTKKFFTATAVLVGTCIGAGVLGIPYVAAQSGFFIALAYIFVLGGIMLLLNLYLGEIALRTKQDHQLPGYAEKYLGRKGGWIMEFALVFGVYSAIIAYMLGIGESISVLIFGNADYSLVLGVGVGLAMSGLLWRGMKGLKRFERIGVSIVLTLLVLIIIVFAGQVDVTNLYTTNFSNIFLPFGVILFALMSFSAVPEVEIILKGNEKLMKKSIILSTIICITFYTIFAWVVVGFKGSATPEIATLTLGPIFILLGIFTMFTSYLALGNALQDNFLYDERFKKSKAWSLVALVPIILFLIIQMSDFFSFTKILSIGGTIAGGLTAILILLMIRSARKKGNRKPEYSIHFNDFIKWILILIFVVGILVELGLF